MEPKKIQKLIETTYGKTATGQAYYRLVWSEDLWEIRRGDFSGYTAAGLYLGTRYNVVDKVKKYEYLKDRWILEFYAPQLQALVAASNKEIVQSDGYEPLYVFQKHGQYQKPEWWAIQYLVKRHKAILEHVEHRTEAMDRREHEESVDREALQMMDYLEQEESTDWMNKFRYQEAVLIHKG